MMATPPRPLPPYGMLSAGNIDPSKRPVVRNPDGSISTVRTISVGFDNGEVLIPTVSPDGRILSDDDAIKLYQQTGQNFGTFRNPDAATMFARQLHDGQADMYGNQPTQAAQQPVGKQITLNVNGRKVKVGDSFMSLSPQQQEATVNEIAASMGQGGPVSLQGKVEPKGSTGEVSSNVQGLDAQGGYDFSLKRYREGFHPTATDEKWNAAVTDRSLGLAPYDAYELLKSGTTLGLSDEIAGAAGGVAGLLSGQDPAKAFTLASDLERAKAKLGREQQGLLGATAEVAGSIFSGRPDLAAGKVAGIIPQAIEAGKGSVLPGFIQGFASDNGNLVDRTRSGAAGGAIGGVVGTGIGAAGAKLGDEATKIAQSFATGRAVKNAPVIDDIRTAATDLFNSSKASGTAFTPNKFNQVALDLVRKAKGRSIDPDLDGDALFVYRRMAELAQKGNQSGSGVTLSELHNLRQKAQDVALTAEKDRTKEFARAVIDGLDDLMTNPKPSDMIGGTQAAGDMLEGISLWSRSKKMALLEEVITKAQYQKSGFENGLRLGFLNLLKNPKTRKLFTAAELAELERVGNGTLPANLLNLAGKFGFSKSGNGLGGFLGGTAGFAFGGPLGAAATALGGSAARVGAEKLTRNAAERAVKAIATSNLPQVAQKLLPPAIAPSLVTGGQTYGKNYLAP